MNRFKIERSDQMKDAELIILLEKSPEKARAALVNEYRNYVYAVVLSKLKGNAALEEIEDCVNDALVEILESISGYSGKGSVKAFIGTIAVRVALNRFRRNIRYRNTTTSIDTEVAPLLTSDEDTEGTVQDNAFRKRLWEIVDMLGEPDSKIIVYQYCYELKVHEIADILSMTPAAIQKRSIRARKRIRKILEKENLI